MLQKPKLLMYVKEERRKKKAIRHNYKLRKTTKYLKFKIKLLKTKPTTGSDIEALAKETENLH
jgi:hypothetical protein